MSRILQLLLALSIIGVAGWSFFSTLDPDVRIGTPASDRGMRPPDASCWSGYDQGLCVAQQLKGGVHSFVLPGLWAMLVSVLGGTVLGLSRVSHHSGLARLAQGTEIWLDSLPRLVFLYMAYVLSQHSPQAFGIALGVLSIPGLSQQIHLRVSRLAQTDFIQAARAHGLSESYILLRHLLWLSCRGDMLRHAVSVFGAMVLVQTSLAYALGDLGNGLWETEASWGVLLRASTSGVYDSLFYVGEALLGRSGMAVTGPWTFLLALKHGLSEGWQHGLPQFLWISACLISLLWATRTLVYLSAYHLERER